MTVVVALFRTKLREAAKGNSMRELFVIFSIEFQVEEHVYCSLLHFLERVLRTLCIFATFLQVFFFMLSEITK